MVFVVVLCVAALVWAAFEHRVLSASYRRKACWSVTVSRVLAVVALGLFLLPPHRVERKAQDGRLKLAVILDGSASMDVRAQGDTRRRHVEKMLAESGAREFFQKSGRVEWRAFAEKTVPLNASAAVALPRLPGNTRLGDGLAALLRLSEVGTPLAAAILVSDGRCNDGASPTEVAKQLAAKGIPVSTVAVPEDDDALDVRVKADAHALKAVKYAKVDIAAKIYLTGCRQLENLPVELVSNGAVLDTAVVAVRNDGPCPVRFTTQLPLAGFQTFAVRIKPPKEDCRGDNNVDYVSVEVSEAAEFNVLYLAYGIDWEWRFLNIHCERNPQLHASAIIQTGGETFAFAGKAAEKQSRPAGFPEKTEDYQDYDVIIANGGLFQHLNDRQLDAVVAFVENKGGGLLVRGAAEKMPEKLRTMLPARKFARMVVQRPMKLDILDDLVFKRDTARILQNQQGVWCMPPAVLDVVATPKNSMRIVATTGESAVMAVQSYGAGRVAFLGMADTWKWAMGEKPAPEIYAAFWNHLVAWMAETGQPMLKIAENGAHVTVGEPRAITVDVLGEDFRPAMDDVVSAVVTYPDGASTALQMLPSLDEIGRYTADFIPGVPGECKIAVTAKGKTRTLAGTASCLATLNSREMDDMTADNALLQDVARITGGKFMTSEEFPRQIGTIPLSSNIPLVETTVPVVPRWLLFCLFAAAASLAWWNRRRLGLV